MSCHPLHISTDDLFVSGEIINPGCEIPTFFVCVFTKCSQDVKTQLVPQHQHRLVKANEQLSLVNKSFNYKFPSE